MSDYRRKIMTRVVLASLLFSPVCLAQKGKTEAAAQKEIDAGNQAWVNGMKAGQAARIAATYAENAIDCGPAGDCIQGRSAIAQHIKDQFEKRGRARSAFVTSADSVQQGNFVYEWGQAEATLESGINILDKYLTVWQKQRDGSWKIFRNLVIPNDDTR